jgi:opacity protein-like surface antigen
MKKLLMLSVALATLSMPAMAQNAITGTVTDTKGAPMPGAKVQIKGTNESVLTNMDGTFSIVTNKKNPKLRAEYAGWDATTKTGKDGMVIKMGKSSWLHFKPEKSQFFVGVNAAFPESNLKYASPGIMLGVVKNIGFYLKGQFNGTVSDDKYRNGWFNGNDKRKYWSASGGLIARIYGPIYLYGGCGYEERKIYWELMDGCYVENDYDSYDGVMVEGGAMLRFGCFYVQGGIQLNAKEIDSKLRKGNFGLGIYF